jgi:hypothetical protein
MATPICDLIWQRINIALKYGQRSSDIRLGMSELTGKQLVEELMPSYVSSKLWNESEPPPLPEGVDGVYAGYPIKFDNRLPFGEVVIEITRLGTLMEISMEPDLNGYPTFRPVYRPNAGEPINRGINLGQGYSEHEKRQPPRLKAGKAESEWSNTSLPSGLPEEGSSGDGT